MEVKVVAHQVEWKEAFRAEKSQLVDVFGHVARAIHHIGSTSIPGIVAKPIIDILLVADVIARVDSRNGEMKALGYECMGEFGIPGRRYFRKNNASGARSHQIHAFQENSPDITRHLAFRDYLIAHPNIAREYSDLKEVLARDHPHDLAAYMDGKDPLIKRIEAEAVRWRKELSGDTM